MEIPSWAGKVATVVGLASPITAPIVVGKWIADKADSTLGKKSDPAPVSVPTPPPATALAPQPVVEKPGDIKPAYSNDPKTQTNGAQRLAEPGQKWNGTQILNGQTQLSKDDPSNEHEQANRCGPSAVLASAVMAGPDATGRMVDRLANKTQDAEEKAELAQIKARIADGTATHKDLSQVQHVMYRNYHEAGTAPGVTTGQVAQMQKDLNDDTKPNSKLADWIGPDGTSFRRTSQDGSHVEESPDRLKSRVSGLQPGQSFVQFVDPDGGNDKLRHFVLIGKDKDGRTYVYDPGAKTNQPQVVYQSERPQAFDHYVGGDMGVNDGGVRTQVVAGGVATSH
ncbi:hypothetical protein IV102_03795 [bacterium]|nr:hypothetical protein [bacterium]